MARYNGTRTAFSPRRAWRQAERQAVGLDWHLDQYISEPWRGRVRSVCERVLRITEHYFDGSAVFWLTLGISGGAKRRPMHAFVSSVV